MTPSKFILTTLLLGLAAPAYTTHVDRATIDLPSLYPQARLYDPQFAQAQAQWLSERENYPQARANLLPNLSAQANYTKADTENRGGISTFTQGGETTTEGYNVTLIQPIYNHGAWAGLSAAKQLVLSAQASFMAAEQSLVLRLTEAYFNVLSAQDNLAFAQSEQAAISRQLKDAQERFEVGMIAITDLHETQAAADLASARAIEANNRLMSTQENLYAMTGVQAPLQAIAATLKLDPPSPNDRQHWQDAALLGNADMLAAQSTYQSRAAEVKAQRSGHYPNLELVAQHSQSEQFGGTLGTTEHEDNRYIVRLNVPLYSGGSVNAKIRSARAQRDSAKNLLDWRKRSAQQSARQAFNNVNAAIARARALQKAALSSQTSLESVQAGYEVGTRTSTDVLAAEREVLRAQRDLSRARYDYLLNQLRLKQSVGQLSEDDLKTITQQ